MSNLKFATMAVYAKYASPWTLCFFLAYISSFFLSGRSVPLPNLDQSCQAVLEYAKTNNFQFGKDIVLTYGPLGFLNTEVSQGLFAVQRILFALSWSGMVAWSATGLAQQIPGRMKFVFFGWFLIYSNLGGVGQHAFLVMIYGSMILMGDVQRRTVASATFLTLFALLSMVKFTFFMAVAVSIILCASVHIGKRNYKSSFAIVAFFGAVFTSIWMVSGQKPRNLFSWLGSSFDIAGGYTGAMTIFPKLSVLVICTVAGALFLAALLVIIRSAPLNFNNAGILTVTASFVFLSWKHGLVRADGHVLGFVLFLPVAFTVLLTEPFQKGLHRKPRLSIAALYVGVVILCNWGADIQEPGTMLTKLVEWPRYMIGNSRLVLNAVNGHLENCFEALHSEQRLKRVPDLPIARAIAGKAPVDVVNYTQAAALANDLNYRPRPVIQGYIAYTPYLQELNLSFYRSEKRPQFLLFNMETIDGRFPTLDDAPLLSYILNNYKPVAKDGEFLVLQAPAIPREPELTLIKEQTIAFGDSMEIPPYNDKLLIMQVEVRPTFFGRMVRFLFQSPVLTLNTKMNGRADTYRFVPAMAERGFIVSPLLLTNNDVLHYFDGYSVNHVDSIELLKPEYAWGQLSNTITVRYYK